MYTHCHVKDLIEALESAKKDQQPFYVAKGLCGLCDVIHVDSREVINVGKLLEKLRRLDANAPMTPSQLHDLCGTCDILIKK